ncbi:MAG: type II toxin-antitoxin system ParD family antitoxin [Promicromonosporaceae bacterium]|nr:type II toxin-antitoxin system ParD family antitoxin [Promicromonosporaceae bacterium]
MPTRNVVITDRQQRFIEDAVRDGTYQNASEIFREGLRLAEFQWARRQEAIRCLQEAVDVGIRALDEGRYIVVKPGETAKLISDIGQRVHQRILDE